jgi:lipid II:glycine glycyltransferase (peptidoglycan interpeptide bridge formation enzyme)
MQKERYGLWIGMVNVRKDLQVIEYLSWEIVKRAKSEGFKKLDLGVSDAGPARYKSKFNPLFEPFFTLNKTDTLHKIYFAYKKLRGLKS